MNKMSEFSKWGFVLAVAGFAYTVYHQKKAVERDASGQGPAGCPTNALTLPVTTTDNTEALP